MLRSAPRRFQFWRMKLSAPETEPSRHLNRVHISIVERNEHETDRLWSEWRRDLLIGKREGFLASNIQLRVI